MTVPVSQSHRNGLTAVGRAPLADRRDDLYETPPEATRALLGAERLPHCIWEPAAGRGAIAKVLREAGHTVIASDLVNYGEPLHFDRRDFLMELRAPDGCQAIVTNPPFKLADQFAAHALDLCPRLFMLLRLAFLEGTRRSSILDTGHLARVHIFRNRLPRMHRDGWEGKQTSSSIAFGWFVWDREYKGETELHRISWRAAE